MFVENLKTQWQKERKQVRSKYTEIFIRSGIIRPPASSNVLRMPEKVRMR